ncbi:Si-specific NAD(P)(+) transhydrogenase [Teredinibacter haidensis]|uniref:Si-specific NAD(P)(+) transhydrogenase n=1 Tax=Teredinibacter haidensis TaxID=2731755 RepID=UPI000948A000|nr:Si-specific NAD(P)(+) transhydrogenase [Teredinibacter haidensis]
MSNNNQYDMLIVGSGPAGQKAALHAAQSGSRVALIEKTRELGGSCVHRGTIPSKTLRENALRVKNMRMNAELANFELPEDVELATLINRLNDVLLAHDTYMRRQLERSSVELIHGRARFISSTEIEVITVAGEKFSLTGECIVIACGSHPHHPDNIAIDHEHLFDSDSVLSMMYLPKSLIVLGGGVIASEYASIFQALGVEVTMIDKYPLPLGFLDSDLTETFVNGFKHMGGTWLGETVVTRAYWNGFDAVIAETEDGRQIKGEKLLCAAGRIANVKELGIENANLKLNDRGLISVDENLQTNILGIYAAGDVIGPPSLASASMEQGRRAACNALDMPPGIMHNIIPTGIYSIPELSSVGLSETQAREQYGRVLVGVARFDEIARGQISGIQNGMLKIVCDPAGKKVLGVMIVGEGATELIHIGQMALLSDARVDLFVESIFNFPTLAEAYRAAALDIVHQRKKL